MDDRTSNQNFTFDGLTYDVESILRFLETNHSQKIPTLGWAACLIRALLMERSGVETDGRESALQRVIDRHVRWRETALGFLRQVVDGRGSEDEWPALAEFLERSDSRMAESSAEKRAACDGCGMPATARCPHCQAVTCGKCAVCEHSPEEPS